MLLHTCGGFPETQKTLHRPPGVAGASRGLQAPPGASRHPAAYCQSLEPWARLKFHAGWSGWTRPPAMAGEGGGSACLQGGVEGVFKGI